MGDAIVLRYVGHNEYFSGVPARNLTQEDVDEGRLDVTALIASGLYVATDVKAVQPEAPQFPSAPSEDDGVQGG